MTGGKLVSSESRERDTKRLLLVLAGPLFTWLGIRNLSLRGDSFLFLPLLNLSSVVLCSGRTDTAMLHVFSLLGLVLGAGVLYVRHLYTAH